MSHFMVKSKTSFSLGLFPQMMKSIELHYQDMLPLPHASEDLLDELMEVQMNVGSPVRDSKML